MRYERRGLAMAGGIRACDPTIFFIFLPFTMTAEPKIDETTAPSGWGFGVAVGLGFALGASTGVATGDVAIGVAVGVATGVAIGAGRYRRVQSAGSDDET